MIVLDQDRVPQTQPVRAAAAQMQRALVQQTPRRLPRADDVSVGVAPVNRLLKVPCGTGDAAHALQQIQPGPLVGQQLAPRPLDFEDGVSVLDGFAILFVYRHFQTVSPQQPAQFGNSRNYPPLFG